MIPAILASYREIPVSLIPTNHDRIPKFAKQLPLGELFGPSFFAIYQQIRDCTQRQQDTKVQDISVERIRKKGYIVARIAQNTLLARVGISKSHLSRQLLLMEQLGFLYRYRDDLDGTVTHTYILGKIDPKLDPRFSKEGFFFDAFIAYTYTTLQDILQREEPVYADKPIGKVPRVYLKLALESVILQAKRWWCAATGHPSDPINWKLPTRKELPVHRINSHPYLSLDTWDLLLKYKEIKELRRRPLDPMLYGGGRDYVSYKDQGVLMEDQEVAPRSDVKERSKERENLKKKEETKIQRRFRKSTLGSCKRGRLGGGYMPVGGKDLENPVESSPEVNLTNDANPLSLPIGDLIQVESYNEEIKEKREVVAIRDLNPTPPTPSPLRADIDSHVSVVVPTTEEAVEPKKQKRQAIWKQVNGDSQEEAPTPEKPVKRQWGRSNGSSGSESRNGYASKGKPTYQKPVFTPSADTLEIEAKWNEGVAKLFPGIEVPRDMSLLRQLQDKLTTVKPTLALLAVAYVFENWKRYQEKHQPKEDLPNLQLFIWRIQQVTVEAQAVRSRSALGAPISSKPALDTGFVSKPRVVFVPLDERK